MSSVIVSGDTSGSITISAPLVAGSGTLTLPVATDTLVGKATTDTLTNKTLTTPTISTITSAAATALTLQSAGTTAITVDTSQNVGIGTSSPTQKLQVAGSQLLSNPGNAVYTYFDSTTAAYVGREAVAGAMVFGVSSAERMRINSSGNLLVGTTSPVNVAQQTIAYFSGNNGLAISTTDNLNATDFVNFRANSATCGAISRVGTTSAVVYTATSDYRLKENVQPFINALATVAKLNPVTYVWKDCGIAANGFIAHELQEVCPDAVVGTKDEIDADGNPKYQAIDQSKIVALLTAAIQEQQSLILALTARLETLEAK